MAKRKADTNELNFLDEELKKTKPKSSSARKRSKSPAKKRSKTQRSSSATRRTKSPGRKSTAKPRSSSASKRSKSPIKVKATSTAGRTKGGKRHRVKKGKSLSNSGIRHLAITGIVDAKGMIDSSGVGKALHIAPKIYDEIRDFAIHFVIMIVDKCVALLRQSKKKTLDADSVKYVCKQMGITVYSDGTKYNDYKSCIAMFRKRKGSSKATGKKVSDLMKAHLKRRSIASDYRGHIKIHNEGCLWLRRAPFSRLMKEELHKSSPLFRISSVAAGMIQGLCEHNILNLFRSAIKASHHAGRSGLKHQDVTLVRSIAKESKRMLHE